MWTIQLPLRVAVSKNRDFSLNLNQYRNSHFQTLDKAKKTFTHLAMERIQQQQIPRLERCALEYILYPGTRQLCDVNNVCSVVDKFFSDSLVHAGVIDDDNYTFIADSRFRFGAIDRENPRVEVTIRDPGASSDSLLPVRSEPSPDHPSMPSPASTKPRQGSPAIMKIQTTTTVTLSQDDVRTAVLSYLKSQGLNASLQEMTYAAQGGDLILTMVSDAPSPSAPASSASSEKPVTRKPAKLDPKVAMQAVEAAQAAKHHAEAESESSSEPESPAVEAEVPEPSETPSPKPEIDHSPKTPEELARDEARLEALAKGKTEAPVPKPPKAPSLFAGFKRPQNS